jgi:hypothetical protein
MDINHEVPLLTKGIFSDGGYFRVISTSRGSTTVIQHQQGHAVMRRQRGDQVGKAFNVFKGLVIDVKKDFVFLRSGLLRLACDLGRKDHTDGVNLGFSRVE